MFLVQRSTVGLHLARKGLSTRPQQKWVTIEGLPHLCDPAWYNVNARILDLIPRKLHLQPQHPLWLLKRRIADLLAKRAGFQLVDDLSPVVSTHQNFDSLLVPGGHVSRAPRDTYYINDLTLLRSHTSAHQSELLATGLNAFLVVGDVYRRDDIDRTHFPVFHQCEGVRLFSSNELFQGASDPSNCLELLDRHENVSLTNIPQSDEFPSDKQPCHTYETLKSLEFHLKTDLEQLARHLFGQDVVMRWVEAYFPFTHPSWELEVLTQIGSNGKEDCWMETLGCGIMRQEILLRSGILNKVGYAFGLGLERWAMQLYQIPDIRLFWSTDSGFLSQFRSEDIHRPIVYRPVSVYPPVPMDISFWLPEQGHADDLQRDWLDLVREVAGDLVEQVSLVDQFQHPKTARKSLCYRIVYRHAAKSLSMDEIRPVHENLAKLATERLRLTIR